MNIASISESLKLAVKAAQSMVKENRKPEFTARQEPETGEITAMGITTPDEYPKPTAKEQVSGPGLEVLALTEPNEISAVKMLEKLSEKYEAQYQLKILPGTLRECVLLANRYMKEHSLPDPALDLLGRTMAAITMMNDTSAKVFDELYDKFQELLLTTAPVTPEDYQCLHSLMLKKVSPVLLGQLADKTQVNTFETKGEYQEYLSKSLTDLQVLAIHKINEVSQYHIKIIISYETGIPLHQISAEKAT